MMTDSTDAAEFDRLARAATVPMTTKVDWEKWLALAGVDPDDYTEADFAVPTDPDSCALLYGNGFLIFMEEDLDDEENGVIIIEPYLGGRNARTACELQTFAIEEGEMI